MSAIMVYTVPLKIDCAVLGANYSYLWWHTTDTKVAKENSVLGTTYIVTTSCTTKKTGYGCPSIRNRKLEIQKLT